MFHVKHQVTYIPISTQSLKGLNSLLDKNHVKLNLYAEQLLWWNNKVNLVSRSVSHETILEHIKHSLLISTLESFQNSPEIIDTGTGGGLPGIPLSICFPEKNFLLNDIVSKKLMVVKQIISKIRLKNTLTNSASIANVDVEKSLIITKHAFKIFELTTFLEGQDWERIIFLKGEKEVEQELIRINDPLDVVVHTLDKVIESDFYKGKSIVEVIKPE